MKIYHRVSMLLLSLFMFFALSDACAETNSMPVINDKSDFYRFAVTLPLGIKDTDDYKTILSRIEVFLNNFEPCDDFERYSLLATKQALYGCKTGGFGIGAILVNPRGEVVDEAYNEMIQAGRSDLHAEMDLIDKYESNRNNPVHATFQLPPGYIVYSSAEPCPMCMIRLASAGVDTYYVAANDADSMARCIDRLPVFWRNMCRSRFYRQAPCRKDLSDVAYLLFYTMVFVDYGRQK